MNTCRTCKHVSPDEGDTSTGWCHRGPPGFVEAPISSGWPPVGLDRGWCGEYSRAWWRWLRSFVGR